MGNRELVGICIAVVAVIALGATLGMQPSAPVPAYTGWFCPDIAVAAKNIEAEIKSGKDGLYAALDGSGRSCYAKGANIRNHPRAVSHIGSHALYHVIADNPVGNEPKEGFTDDVTSDSDR
jgi:hypothetical protein